MNFLNIFALSLVFLVENSVKANNLPPGCLEAFRKTALTAHNIFRTRHDSPVLTVSPTLEASALKYAQYLAVNDVFKHSTDRVNTGENLYVSYSDDPLTAEKCARKFDFKCLF